MLNKLDTLHTFMDLLMYFTKKLKKRKEKKKK